MGLNVGRWLQEQGLERYEQAFQKNDIDERALPQLTGDDLKEIGVASVGHRRKLLEAIEDLRHHALPTQPEPQAQPGSPAVETGLRPDAGRRHMTVMFSDLVGSTALSAQLDPEDMREVIRGYQDACAGVITRFEGHVAKYMGDGVLAYFGWPRAHEDDAERAVRAGLEITKAVGALPSPASRGSASQSEPEATRPLAARVGIASGLVVVGDLTSDDAASEQAAIGEPPSVAERLQHVAGPGQVVVTAATRRLLGARFGLVEMGPQSLDGLANRLSTFVVTGERRLASRFEARNGAALLPMVGRDQELALLLERWALAKSGEGQGLLLIGEAGIGKSRITKALLDALADEPHIRVRGQCSPYHTDSALWPTIQQLTHAAGFASDDSSGDRHDKLEAVLRRASNLTQEATHLIANLIGLDGDARFGTLDLAPRVQRARTLEALVNQVLGLATQAPVLAILEDAHWIDPTTLELMERILDRMSESRVLMLLTSRPDHSPDLAPHPHVTRLTLNRLSRTGARAIVGRLGGDRLPNEIIDTIVTRTDGVPLFVEELTKAILETDQATIPASLHDSLMARLDRIPDVSELAQIAACIGRSFSYPLLAALAERPEAELQASLDQLVATELIFRRGEPPEATYTFKHALVRDAAYESLLKSRREAIHARLLGVLERDGNVAPEILAKHAKSAGLIEKAIAYWQTAAEQAGARSAYLEATNHLNSAIEVVGCLPEPMSGKRELELQIDLGGAILMARGHGAPGVAIAYERAYELCQTQAEVTSIGPVLFGLWRYHVIAPRLAKALQLGEDLLRLTSRDEEPWGAFATCALAVTTLFQGRLNTALNHFRAISVEAEPDGDCSALFRRSGLDPRPGARIYEAQTLWLLGYPEQARQRTDQALALARNLSHPFSLAYALSHGSFVFQFLGEEKAVRLHVEEAIGLAKQQGFPVTLASAHHLLGWVHARSGDPGAGLAEMAKGGEIARGAAMGVQRPYFLTLAADAHQRRGDLGRALGALADAKFLIEKHEERWWEAEVRRLEGNLILARPGEAVSEAEICFAEALEVARQQNARSLELRAAVSLARLLAIRGERSAALELLASVYGWFTEGFDTRDLLDAKSLIDQLR
ncbi:MAG: AAA family ATPase [Pseudomonadota bacterium]